MRRLFRRTRVRLTLTYTGVVALALCAGAAAFWIVFSDALLGSIDSSLRGQAQILASGLRASGSTVVFNGARILPSETPEGAPIAAALVSADGRILEQAGQPVDAAAARALALADAASNAQPVIDSRRTDAEHERFLVQRLGVGGERVTLILSRSLDEYDQTMGLTTAALGATVVLLVLTAGLSAYWLAGRVLRPVRIITATARDLGEHSLDRRITLDLPPDELGNLAATFNEMLDRLEAAFQALRRFTADAAHELRSPLTALRAEVEVVARHPRDRSEYQAALDVVLRETERLGGVTDQLLLLARADAGTLRPQREAVDVSDVLEEVAERWRPLAAESSVKITVRTPGEGMIEADPTLLWRLLNNLLDNAIRYTPPAGHIILSGEQAGGRWVLTVEDSGSGVDVAMRPFLFQRFRAVAADYHNGGAGLGLSLCAAIATAHGGSIRLADDPDDTGARFVVSLPVHDGDGRGSGAVSRG